MLKIIDVASPEDRAQIVNQLELAQLTYRAALMEMGNVYRDITDDVTFFGFQPDYIPFPALDPLDDNAFEKSIARARAALLTAAEKEVIALQDDRSFETDSALFQSALAQLRDRSEAELSAICGTFTVIEGGRTVVYPAIPKYAYLDPKAAAFGDPCGLMGNGSLHEAAAAVELGSVEFQKLKLGQKNLLAEIADVNARTTEQCGRITTARDFRIEKEDKKISLQQGIESLETIISGADRTLAFIKDFGFFLKCSTGVSTDCPAAMVASTAYTVAAGVTNGVIAAAEITIAALEIEVLKADKAIISNEYDTQCTAMQIDATYEVKAIYRRMLELQLDALKLDYEAKLAISSVQKLRNQSIQLMSLQAENEAHLINVEAARNDPNVRIYRNDAVLAADRTFYSALREAYKATKVYEYYTSQSYAPLQNLVLVRMVSHGDFTLEAYLSALQDSFIEFEEQYGNPDTRAVVISVKDDVLNVPRLDGDGIALGEDARTAKFRELLQDVSRIDENGYIAMPFATSLDALSPLTRNHKIRGMEVELVGKGVGDSLGRVYIRQRGTGSVRSVDGRMSYYAFPQRTAVMDPFFNGVKEFNSPVYWSERLRDRPLLNTGWEVVLNRKDEAVNKDIDLGGLDDIKLYVYYTDFTQL
jgi:hypothetical protein